MSTIKVPQQTGRHTIGSLETWNPDDKSFDKRILKEGVGDCKPNEGAVCRVNIRLLGDDTIDEGSLSGYRIGADCDVTIGNGDTAIAELFDRVIMTMKESEECYIKSKLDKDGNLSQDIMRGAQDCLKFNVALHWFSRAADLADLQMDELLERAEQYKERGTALYKADNVTYSIKQYEKALACLQFVANNNNVAYSKQYKSLLSTVHLNLAATYIKTEAYELVVTHSTSALAIMPTDVKGLYRRGQAYAKLSRFEESRSDLADALRIEPDNKAIIGLLRTVDTKLRQEKQMYVKMFAKH